MRAAWTVLVDHFHLPAENTAGLIDFINRQINALLGKLTVGGSTAGQDVDAADPDRILGIAGPRGSQGGGCGHRNQQFLHACFLHGIAPVFLSLLSLELSGPLHRGLLS